MRKRKATKRDMERAIEFMFKQPPECNEAKGEGCPWLRITTEGSQCKVCGLNLGPDTGDQE